MIGTTLSHYRITAKLGEGGMGEVYRAHDERLDRDVAIKVLPEAVAEDADRLARFEREAKLLASLSHQNIAALHGFEEHKGQRFLVMELADGETLAERVKKGPIPVDDALPIALQIAEGLEAAHEHGIIHRDLKPANVMVSAEGKVKILDFGLAKAWQPEESDADLTQSPTLTAQMTAAGVLLGTAAYMSPEQACGKPVDKRADIWAFGCVLYEMLTGRKAFEGDSVTEIIASILKTNPDWELVPAKVPRAVLRLMRDCMCREPETRLGTIAETRAALAVSSPSRWTAIVNRAGATVERSWRLWWVLAVLAIAAIVFWQWTRPRTPPAANVTLRPLTANPLERSVTGAAISPDGKYLAYVDPDGLHLQVISSGEARVLELGPGLAPWRVKWYPGGTRLLLLAETGDEPMGLWSVNTLGGRVRKLHARVDAAAVSPDGQKIAFLRDFDTRERSRREIWLSGPDGEDARLIIEAGPEESLWNLAWSPDSACLAYGTWGRTVAIKSRKLNGTEPTVLLSGSELWQAWTGPLPFVWAPDGRLVFSKRERLGGSWDLSSSSIWAVETDVDRCTTRGQAHRITRSTRSNVKGISLSDDGRQIVAHLVRSQSDVWVGHLNHEGTAFTDETRITDDEWLDYAAAWTRDSRSVLVSSIRGETTEILQIGISDAVARPMVHSPAHNVDAPMPTYSADGRFLLYRSKERGVSRVPVDGGPPAEVIADLRPDAIQCPASLDPQCLAGYIDGAEYVFVSFDIAGGSVDEVLRIRHRPPFTNWRLSRDGSTLAVVHNTDNTIRLVSLTSGVERALRVRGWASFEFVDWSADGRRLFVNANFDSVRQFAALLSVDLQGNATVLRQAPSQWHVYPMASPDGRYLAFSSMPFHGNAWLITGFE
jgi:Tol biopolymer transport system component